MVVLLYFHGYLEVRECDAHIGALVIGVLPFGLGIYAVRKALTKIGEQRVSAGVLRFRLERSSVRILIPVLFPVVGIAIPYHGGQLAQAVHHQGGEVACVGGCTAFERLTDLLDSKTMI